MDPTLAALIPNQAQEAQLQTNVRIDSFLAKIEQILKSEIKVVLMGQLSMERRQAKIEMLVNQWINVGSLGVACENTKQSNTQKSHPGRAVGCSSQPYSRWSQQSSASDDGDYHRMLPNGDEAASPGQDRRELSDSHQPIGQSGTEVTTAVSSTADEVPPDKILGSQAPAEPATARAWLVRKSRPKVKPFADRSFLERIVFSLVFDVVFGMLIVLNTISIGAEIEYKTTHATPSTFFKALAAIFAVFFTVELVLRLTANDLMVYFCGPDRLWNIFDVAMVVVSLIEVSDTLVSSAGQSNPSLRLVRMLRLLRIARVLRFIPQLRMMIFMILESIKSLFWLLCLLVTILYIFSIVFTMGAIDYLGVVGDPNFRDKKKYSTEIEVHFGSLIRSLYSLFKAITSGQSWGEIMDPLTDVGTFFVVVFLFYVSFAILALLNIVTGVFVDGALSKSQYDRDLVVEKEMQNKKACVRNLQDLFEEGDVDGSGTVTFQEFEAHLKDERFVAYLSHLAIDTHNIEELFEKLDKDRSGCISVQEFVDNLLNLTKGQNVEQYVQTLMNENRALQHHVFKLMDFVQDEFAHIKRVIEQHNDVTEGVDNIEMVTVIQSKRTLLDGYKRICLV